MQLRQNDSKILSEKVAQRSAKAGVIGLGYVGLPLATAMARAGFQTIGFDVSQAKVDSLNQGRNYIADVDPRELSELIRKGTFRASSDFSLLKECDFISVCVPTPLGKGKNPDMSYIQSAVAEISRHLRKGQAIILESTTYPGTTSELVLPMLQKTGLTVGQDFHLAFSPERIDPGNKVYTLKNTPKIVGGITRACTEIIQAFYGTFVDKVIPVSSSKAAEMVKLLENTFRAINIGLANELAIMCDHLGVDSWEVIDAAASKPFGFMAFYPGPGLGGHCIPVDPHYLVWKLKLMDYNPRFIQLADEINSSMPRLVVEKVGSALNDRKKPLKDSKILVLGVAYKRDVDDFRESPALEVIRLLQTKGAQVSYHDPFVPQLKEEGIDLTSTGLDKNLSAYDCVVLLTHHSAFDVGKIVEQSQLFMDTRNATKSLPHASKGFAGKIVKL